MAKRMMVMIAVTFAVIALLGFVKFRQIQTAMAQGASFRRPLRPSPRSSHRPNTGRRR